MICGCCKDLGCFAPNQEIDFGLKAILAIDPYVFHIWGVNGYQTMDVEFDANDPIVLPYTFNENGEVTIKIEFPADFITANGGSQYGVNFLTTPDGACCFTIHGMIPTCA